MGKYILSQHILAWWVNIRDHGNNMKIIVGAYCWPPDQEEPIEGTFLLQLQEVSHVQEPVLLDNFNHLHIFEENIMVSCQETPVTHGGKRPGPSKRQP